MTFSTDGLHPPATELKFHRIVWNAWRCSAA